MFKRRAPDPALVALRAAFHRVAVHVDGAQRALLAAIPTARDPGVPLGQALGAFKDRLDAAQAGMAAWRDDSVDAPWERCTAALVEARRAAERLRLGDETLGFEALNARIGEVLDPLETFADVERDLRRRR